MTSETTITILPTHLRLVHIPLGQMHSEMSRILDCWWFRRKDDPFFALCHNGVELSLFADAKAVRRCFADCMSPCPPPPHHGSSSSSDTKGKSPGKDDRPIVGDDLFIALEIAFGGNGWSTAAPRLQALTSPLASAGISIFFISTFYADYILLRSSALPLATEILESEGFGFSEADEGMVEEMRVFREREGEELSAAAAGSGAEGARTPRRSSGWADEDDPLGSGMMGSLVLSDAGSGSAGGSRDRSGSRTGSTSASRSNSLSLSRSNSLSMSSSTPLSPPLATTSPQPSPSLGPTATSFSATSPDAPPLSLLPDELVCVGLSPAHESVWRSKIVETLFFAERVLPRPSGTSVPSSSSGGTRAREEKNRSDSLSTSSFPLDLSRPSSSHAPPSSNPSPSSASSHLPPPPSSFRPIPLRTPSTTLPTPCAPHPTPFLALTQPAEGTSLIADVRLLRKVFCDAGEGGEEEKGVWVSGEGGLGGLWEGEEGVEGWEEAEEDEEDAEEEEEMTASEDESGSSVRSSAGEEEGWEPVSPGMSTREMTEDEEEQEGEGASERTLLKCLQLDLTRFGLDKPGLVEYYTSLLIEGGVRSLLYQSTFGSANILVAKRDVGKARRLLMRA